uniref:Uncharacterized protein n=1 Tax=Rhizophora mucronata TaxID=61149 RepID=A0A2P2QBR3_RHIMU
MLRKHLPLIPWTQNLTSHLPTHTPPHHIDYLCHFHLNYYMNFCFLGIKFCQCFPDKPWYPRN